MDTWANELARDMDMDKTAALMLNGSGSFLQFGDHSVNVMTVTMILPTDSRSDDSEEYEDLSDTLPDDAEPQLLESPMYDDLDHPNHQNVSHEETVHASNSRISREEKNERERTRVKRKGDLLEELKQSIKQSCLIPPDAKRKRFTELYTLQLTQQVILAHRMELQRLGHPSQTRLPFASSGESSHINSPIFKQFDKVMRSSLADILHKHACAGEKVTDAQLSNFISNVWNSIPLKEKQQNWSVVGLDKKNRYLKLAAKLLTEE